MRFLASAAFIAAMTAAVPAMAACDQAICPVPTVQVNLNRVESQAQLADQLRQEGYSQIRMSAYEPASTDPRPDLTMPNADPAQTSVHTGWNGTAVRDGSVMNIYVN